MSLSQKNVGLIQKSGEAVDAALRAISETVREQAESMVANLTASAFGEETEQVLARFKTLSNITHGLSAVQSQLRSIAAMAADLRNLASDVILVKEVGRRKALSNAAAVDVVAEPEKPAKAAKPGKGRGRKPAPAGSLTANDTKLLAFLQEALKSGAPTAISGEALATGSGLPKGSMGVSMKKLMTMGAVNSAGRGMFQISASVAPSAPALELTSALPTAKPGREPKAVASKPAKVVKTVKANAVKVGKPAKPDKEAKASVESKATPAKKAKGTVPAAEKVAKTEAVSVVARNPKSVAKKAKAEAPAKAVRAKATKASAKAKPRVKSATSAPSDALAALSVEAALV